MPEFECSNKHLPFTVSFPTFTKQLTCEGHRRDNPAYTGKRISAGEILWLVQQQIAGNTSPATKTGSCSRIAENRNRDYRHIELPSAESFLKKMAELIKKIWEVDPLISPGCGGEMKIIVLPDDSEVVAKILKQLNLWSESALDRTRASPQPDSNNSYEPFYDDIQRNPKEWIVG